MAVSNPFIQRGQISDPRYFSGRWSELSLVFQAIESSRPVFIVGSPGIGKSSLLKHITQSAALNLERFDLRSFYLDLAPATAASGVYDVIIRALGRNGHSLVALDTALANSGGPVMLCLDNGDAVAETEWGAAMLDDLVRLARAGRLMLVVAQNTAPPIFSERVVSVRLGAFAAAEVRLLTDIYLEGTGVQFTPRNLQQLYRLSQGHPVYLQRAAYHLFEAKLQPEYSWLQRYREEAYDQPIPGAPLPPAVFEGADGGIGVFSDAEDVAQAAPDLPPRFDLESSGGALFYALPLILGALLFLFTQNIWLAALLAFVGLAVVIVLRQRRRLL